MKKLLLYIFLTHTFTVLPCFWDYDTIEMERQDFPGVVELIAGKFLRHSPEYHYWRIKDREVKLQKHPDSLSLYDDMAVSYSKIGNQKKAIEIILKKDSLQPGLYETYANLGTFYLHDGQYEKGIEYIDIAIEINPDAHFGREIYQKYLAEYVLSKSDGGEISLPLDFSENKTSKTKTLPRPSGNFYQFIASKRNLNQGQRHKWNAPLDPKILEAKEGILGMMKFGDYNSPILLEVLGDLLMNSGNTSAARQLAARAYLKASYFVEDEKSKRAYRNKATFALELHINKEGPKNTIGFDVLEKLLKDEMKSGEKNYASIRKNEINWILNAEDPEEKFSEKYYENPELNVQKGEKGVPIRKLILEMRINYLHEAELKKQNIPKVNFHQPDSSIVKQIDSIFEARKNGIEVSLNEHQNKENNQDKPTKSRDYTELIYILVALMTLLLLIFGRHRFKSEK